MSSTNLRIIGGSILLVNLYLIDLFKITGIYVLLLTFGFVIAYEYLIVKKFSK